METLDRTALFIEENREVFTAISDTIWNFAELGYEEVRSAALHIQYLEKAGFRVKKGVADIPTAFVAEAGSGGPVIAILGEYDALSSLSQESGAFTCRPSNENDNGNGHGCGHHLLGTAAHLAAAAVKDALDRSGLPGTIRFYGCPAEEGGSGKAFMARAGLFDDVDAALSWHPAPVTSVWMQGSLANVQVSFRFTGKASHAAASPHLGRSALDAVELTNVGVNYLREHMLPEARVHYAVTDTGGRSPNVVQANAEVVYLVRATTGDEVQELYERVCNVARGAALMTGCKLEIDFSKGCSNLVLNTTLNKVIHRHLVEQSGPSFDAADYEFATQMQERALLAEDIESMGRTFGQAMRKPRALFEGVAPFDSSRDYPASGSTDVGDVSWVTPTAQCLTACYAFGTPAHSWQWVAQGKSSIAHKGMLLAARTLAATAIELLQSPDLLTEARAEFNERLNGKKYVCPIPDSVSVTSIMGKA